MNLRELISGDVTVELYAISNDEELASEIQQRLIELGLLDPPPDRRFGPQSRAALRRFGERAGVNSSSVIDARVAARLLEFAADDLYPLNPGDDFPSRIIRFMQTRSYWIGRPQGYLNIVYVEGVNENGGRTAIRPTSSTTDAYSSR